MRTSVMIAPWLRQQPQAGRAVHSTQPNARSVSAHAKRDVFFRPKGDILLDDMSAVQMKSRERPVIQWYPGHIAKAERQLKEQLSKVPPVYMRNTSRSPGRCSSLYIGTPGCSSLQM